MKTHSIVAEDCELRPNHIGKLVTYKGKTGYLIRYITSCDHNLLELTTKEAVKCLNENYPPTALDA